jgi:hypothetical protein
MLALRGSILLTTLWWPAAAVAAPRQTLWALRAVAVAVELFLAAPLLVLLATALVSVVGEVQTPMAVTQHCSALRLSAAVLVVLAQEVLVKTVLPGVQVVAVLRGVLAFLLLGVAALKAATVAVPSTAPINPTAQAAVVVLAVTVETLWPHPTAEMVAQA